MNKTGIDEKTMRKTWSICMVSALVLASLLASFMFYNDARRVVGEPPWVPMGSITGAPEEKFFGWNTSSAGDINGDGYDDIIIGAPFSGTAYMFLGKPGFMGDITADNADIVINGSAVNGSFGWSVAAWNVTGDDTTDIIVGAPGYQGDTGAVYIFDGDTLTADADGYLNASEATTMITGENTGDNFGSAVSVLDDVNNDDYGDLFVGAPDYGALKGRAYVFLGNSSIPTNASDADFLLEGKTENCRFGHSVSPAGDMNGDGSEDYIVGAPGENKAYVYFGGQKTAISLLSKPLTKGVQDNSGSNIDDIKLDDGLYFTVNKNSKTMFLDTFGTSGLAEPITGVTLYAQYYTSNNYNSNDNITWALDGQPLQETDIEIIQSTVEVTPPGYDLFAQGVDTLDEITNLDISFTNTASGGGARSVFFDYVWIEVKTKAVLPMLVLEEPGDFGWSLSDGGDVNGDDIGDVVIGAPDLTGSTSGNVYVKYGNFQGFDNETTGITPVGWQQIGPGANDALVSESAYYGSLGKSIEFNWTSGDFAEIRKVFPPASLGDKGVVEFRVRVSENDNEKFYILVGNTTSGNWTSHLAFGSATAGQENYIRYYEGNGDGTGVYYPLLPYAVDTWYHIRIMSDSTTNNWDLYIDGELKASGIGFVSDNTIPDYLSFHQFNAGNSHVEFVDNVVWFFDNPEVKIAGETNGDKFGYSVAGAGDFDGDTFEDIIVGAPQANGNGTAYFFLGNATLNPALSTASANITLEGEFANDGFGWSVSFAGDVNNDGQSNFIVGAPFYDEGAVTDTGKAYIFFGPVLTYQPDLWINGIGDGFYSEIPTGGQVRTDIISAGDTASWWIHLENDGNVNDTMDFSITVNMLPGWTWEMVENGTGKVINDGDSVHLLTGESRNYTLNITSPIFAGALDESWVEVVAKTQNGTSHDSVKTEARILNDLLPEILDVLTIPNPQETGGSVNITCNVTDDIGVSEVWLNISLPGGGFSNMTAGKGAGDLWFYKDVYVPIGLYQYTVWARDTGGNWNSSSGHSFTIQDTTLPEITLVQEIPDPQETGGYVNISCKITDNVLVDTVWLNISLPGGGYSNSSMTPGAADEWFQNTTFLALGLYKFKILANDTSGNWNSSSSYNFTIQDTTLPEISNVIDIPDPQEAEGWVNISCDITDNAGVNDVWINITLPGGGYNNLSMDKGAADQWFHNATHAALGLYEYTIWVNDTSSNWNSSSGHGFTIRDISMPVISNVSDGPDPQNTGGYINISCDVTDDIGVGEVWINITMPAGGFSNSTMDKGVGDQWFYNNTFGSIGLYQYTIWANDTSGNWNDSSGHSFSFQDTSFPVISNVLGMPDPQETGGFVNISCDVTDDIGVSSVWINITLPGGGYSNTTIEKGAFDQWFFNNTYVTLGMYQYTIWVSDTTGNWNSSWGHSFTILDTALPMISNILNLPDPQETGGLVNISCDVIDNVEVDAVFVNISLPGGGFSNISMSSGAGDQWFHESIFTAIGPYQYTIWTNDTSGNWNFSWGHSFTIQDTTPPDISNVLDLPDPQEAGGFVNISCEVTDNVGVQDVWLNISLPGGGYSNVTMDNGAGNHWFHNNTFGALGLYQYTVWVSDTSGNWNGSPGQFQIQDSSFPNIADVTAVPNPQEVNGYVNISAIVTDVVGVYGVWVEIVDPLGGFVGNFSMAYDSVAGRYYLDNVYGILGAYQFIIRANDTDGNWVVSSGHTFTIQDTVSPAIQNVLDSPDPQEVNGYVNITCDVTDNDAVGEVWLNISLPGGGYTNTTMLPGLGSQWFINGTFPAIGTHGYTIWVNDTSGNWNSSSGHDLTIQDTTLPEISNVLDLPDPQEIGGHVNISCDVTDNVDVQNVRVNITEPGGGFNNISMNEDAGNLWFWNESYTVLGMYQYTIWTCDTSGNWNLSTGHEFNIWDMELPEIANVFDIPDPQEAGEYVNISCDITDNYAIINVYVNLSLPGGGYSNVSMNPGAGGQWFLNDTYSLEGSYQYTVWAADSGGNWNSSSGHVFVTIGSEPLLAGPGVLPVLGYVDSIFTFTVNYSHSLNKAPSTMTLNLTGPSGGIFNLDEVNPADSNYIDGKHFYLTTTGLAIGMYSFHFAACDTDGKWVETGALDFNVVNRVPSLSLPQLNPIAGYPDTGFNFSVIYTDPDNHSPDIICVNITGLGTYVLSETDVQDTDFTNGKLYHINIAGIPVGTSYTFHFAARDSMGAWAVQTPEVDAPDIRLRTATLTSFDKTVKYSDLVILNATVMDNGTPVVGVDVAFYIDLNNNGINEPGEYVGTAQSGSYGTVSLIYSAILPVGFYPYISSYQGNVYVVTNSTAVMFVVSKPAAITTLDKLVEEDHSVILNATLEDEDGNPVSLQTIELLVDKNQNSIFEGSEVVGSAITDSSGYMEVTYMPDMGPGHYYIWAKYTGSNNYSVIQDNAILSIQNTSNNPPVMVETVPDQVRTEDSPPWELDLTPFESDAEDAGEDLKWYVTGVDKSLYTVTGMNSSGDVFTFIPVANAYGSNEVTLWLIDSNGGIASQKMWVNITPVNDRPKIDSINPLTIHFDDEYIYFFYNYVSDIEDKREDLALSTDAPEYTTVDGLRIKFLYPFSMNGTTNNVLVTVTDTEGASTSTIVIVRVSDDWVPELEVEIPDITIFEGEVKTNVFDLDDYFSDPDGDALFFATGQSHVTIDINPFTHVVNITAPTDWSGTETVSFHAVDPSQARAEDIVHITVLPINDMPSIGDVPDLVVRFDQEYRFDLSPYISDEDNNASELILSFIDPDTGQPVSGLSVDPSNNLGMIIDLPESMNGTTIQVQIWVSDGYDFNFTAIEITVSDDFPPELITTIPDVSFDEDTSLISAFNIRNFFIDVDDAFIIYTSGYDNINVTINPDGLVDFSAPANWSGSERVTFRATDDLGALVESSITVSVIPVNDAPVIGPMPNQYGEEGRIWVLDISKYLFDIDNDIEDLAISVDSEFVSVVGYTLIFEYPAGIEGGLVTVTVSDGSLSSSNTLSVTVSKTTVPSSGPLLQDYILWILLVPIILAALLIGFIAIKRKITAPYVEEVFLIANDGTLIAHNSLSLEEDIDKDILSGMLTGVKNLISDAFAKEEGRQKGLHKLEFGEKNIMLEKADHFFIALVFSGVENRQLFKKIENVINELEEKYGEIFESWAGDMEIFVDTDEILEPLLSLEELTKEEREQLKDARKRLKEAREMAIRELDLHLVDLLADEEGGAGDANLVTEIEENSSKELMVYECPMCGSPIESTATKCPVCNVEFSESDNDDSVPMEDSDKTTDEEGLQNTRQAEDL